MSRVLFVFLWCLVLNANAIVMTPEQATQPERKSVAPAPSNSRVLAKPIEKQVRSVDSPEAKALVGTWSGTYMCGQGETNVEIEIDKSLNGKFRFFALNSLYGPFDGYFKGKLSVDGSTVIFRPASSRIDDWKVPPIDGGRSWFTAGFTANLITKNRALEGRIHAAGCSTISLAFGRSAASAPLKALEAPSKASLGFFQAALYGNYDMMELYLQQGADINCLNCDSNYQWTALYRALAANGSWNLQLGDWLVQRGADINIPAVIGGATGSTLVMASASAYTPNLQALEWLVQRGANVKAADSLGRTALHYVSQWGHMDSPYSDTGRKLAAFVDLLVDNGIDINGPDKGGVTALMNAANVCSPNAVRLLISHGANTTVKDKLGKTAMDMTMERATHSGQNSPCNEVIKILSNAPQASVSTPSQTSAYPAQRNAVNYAGTYSGTYSGSDSGTFQVSITQDGTAQLNGRSSRMGTSFTGEGKVSSDGSVAVGSASTGSTFMGSVSPSGTLSGTWKNTAYNQAGTFQGNKGATNTAANPLEVINGGLQLLNAILKPR